MSFKMLSVIHRMQYCSVNSTLCVARVGQAPTWFWLMLTRSLLMIVRIVTIFTAFPTGGLAQCPKVNVHRELGRSTHVPWHT